MTDEDQPTRVTLFVPCSKQPASVAVDHEWLENPHDGSFAESFAFGTVDDEGVARIDAAPGALILYSPYDLSDGREQVLELIRGIPEALAVRVEQSKLGWERDVWLELVGSDEPRARHRAVVTLLGGDGFLQSCGMHAFSLPDARVDLDDDEDGSAPTELLTTYNAYQIGEDPLLLSGQTFSPDADSPRRVVQRWPDDGYPQSSPCYNPFGVWRLGAPGSRGQGVTEHAAVFMPPLVTILFALEEKNGEPLTREQVVHARDSSVCMAMDHADARELERRRGYGDIDPELAWEQWQIVRVTAEDD